MAKKAEAPAGPGENGVSEEEDKKKKLTPDEQLLAAFQSINKSLGKGTIGVASQMANLDVPRLATGDLPIDLSMGGGIPMGRILLFWGEQSGGKTFLAMKCAIAVQRACGNCYTQAEWTITELGIDEETGLMKYNRVGKCVNPACKKFRKMKVVWGDIEGRFDIPWALIVGVWVDELYIFRPETAENTVDIAESIIRTRACDAFVVDSIAAMTPQEEVEQSASKQQQGLGARIANKMVRKMVAAQNEVGRQMGTPPTIIWINQVRQKIGVMFGSPDTLPNGKGQLFAASVELKCWSGKSVLSGNEDDDPMMRDQIAQELTLKVIKNSTFPTRGREFEYKIATLDSPVHKAGEIMDEQQAFMLAVKYGLVTHDTEKKTLYRYEGERYQRSQIELSWMQDRPKYRAFKLKLLELALAR